MELGADIRRRLHNRRVDVELLEVKPSTVQIMDTVLGSTVPWLPDSSRRYERKAMKQASVKPSPSKLTDVVGPLATIRQERMMRQGGGHPR